MAGCVSGCSNRIGVVVVADVAAAGRWDRPAGVCAGVGGYRSQPSDAVSRLVPQQTRIYGYFCRVFG